MPGVDFEIDEVVVTDYESIDAPVGVTVRAAARAGSLACIEQDAGSESGRHNGHKVNGAAKEILRVTSFNGGNAEHKEYRNGIEDKASDRDPIAQYLEDISIFPLLKAEDEVRLAGVIEVGKAAADILADNTQKLSKTEKLKLQEAIRNAEEAKTEFIQSNLKLVVFLARKIKTERLPLLDKIQLGNLGLMHAVDLFDARKGFKFSTYAGWWIRQYIFRGIAYEGANIPLKARVLDAINAFNRASELFIQAHGRIGTTDEVIEEFRLDPKNTKKALQHVTGTLSLNVMINENSNSELGDMIADELSISPEELVTTVHAKHDALKMLDILEERERIVMELIYIRSMNTREIAKQLNIANSLVQAVKNRALSKLRHPSQSAGDRFENEEDWREKASCLGINNIDLFFPSRGEDTKSARGVCSGCRVAEDCLGYALRNSEKNGIWGGKSERERRGLRRAQAQSSRKPTAE